MIRSATTNATVEMEREIMSRTKVIVERASEFRLARMVTLGLLVLSVLIWSRMSLAQETGSKTFSSAAEASHALFLAVGSKDEQTVGAILGAGKEITSSSDEVEDQLERDRFSQKYQEMHRLVQEPDGKTILYIGAQNWPFPIPLVSKNGSWFFDADAGKWEILFRQIGENEATAIEVCRAFAAAKKQQRLNSATDDAIQRYARSLSAAGNSNREKNAQLALDHEASRFHGYEFRTVNVSGGAKKNALSMVAYPAEYQSSGVMTFIVTEKGVVYERDLGTETTKLAPQIKQVSLHSKWHSAE